jgi:hypothetical protein
MPIIVKDDKVTLGLKGGQFRLVRRSGGLSD